jgi:hypothetical protein
LTEKFGEGRKGEEETGRRGMGEEAKKLPSLLYIPDT